MKPKDKENRLREEVLRCNIQFIPPGPISIYPEPFREIFSQIHEINRIKYADFDNARSRSRRAKTDMKLRVLTLREGALLSRQWLANESTWRDTTEIHVFNRFKHELNCPSCNERLWGTDLGYPSDNENGEVQHGRRHVRRSFCNCDEMTRKLASIKALEDGRRPVFASVVQEQVFHDPSPNLGRQVMLRKAPDRVIGLDLTGSLTDLTNLHPDLVHSPFVSGADHLIYPFLVVEAKSEKGSSSFASVERQTALPIRTFLKIQNQLRSLVSFRFHPLVWFLAFTGDIWHVYGCTYIEEECRVYNLWQGTIRSEDQALQLLLIVDIICDWARKYRRSVQRCLGQNNEVIRGLSPTFTTQSSQYEESVLHRLSQEPCFKIPHRSISVAPSYLESDDIPMAGAGSPQENEHYPDIGDSGLADLASQSATENGPKEMAAVLAIRHVHQVLFKFRCIALPEDHNEMHICLKRLLPRLSTNEAAFHILRSLLQNEIVLSSRGIVELQCAWTGMERPTKYSEHALCRSLIFFATFMRKPDWRIVRQMTWISCTKRALVILSNMAITQVHDIEDTRMWNPHSYTCPCLLEAVRVLKRLPHERAVDAAWNEAKFILRTKANQSHSQPHLAWDRLSAGNEHDVLLDLQCFDTSLDVHADGNIALPGHESSALKEVPRVAPLSADQTYPCAITLKPAGHDALLLVRRETWPLSAPEFCLMIFTEHDSHIQQVAADCLEKLMQARSMGFVSMNDASDVMNGRVRILCHDWVEMLRNGNELASCPFINVE